MIDKVLKAITDADNLTSKLPIEVSQAPGLSNQKVRHLLNNLCSIPNARYLNVGLFTGSSFWSAIFHNDVKATGIDFWRNNVAAKCDEINFWKNLGNILSFEKNDVNREVHIINQDCFTVDLKEKYNVYFYDADHTFDGQYNALKYYDRFLDDNFIFIVDDFDDTIVKAGTEKALQDYEILYRWEGKGQFGDWRPNSEHWWNGILVCILQKKEAWKI